MPNPFVHVELNTDDTGKAKQFYSQIFNWQLDEMPMPNGSYTFIKAGDGTGGGIFKKPMPEAPNMWLPYVQVDDVAGTLDKARKLGAKVVVEKTPIPEMGAFGIFIDPSGAVLGLWENAKK